MILIFLMTVIGGNLYENYLYAEELVKEKRLFDAVISLEVCTLLVPSVFILSFKIVWRSLLFWIILKKTLVVLHFIVWRFPFAPSFYLIEHNYLLEIFDQVGGGGSGLVFWPLLCSPFFLLLNEMTRGSPALFKKKKIDHRVSILLHFSIFQVPEF